MFAKDYVDYYSSNRQYAPYLKSDALLSCLPASFRLNKLENKMIEFIEKEQLFDTRLWKLFTEQFKAGNVDDENLGWRGEYWGKMMRGACITYKYTQSSKLYGILENTVYTKPVNFRKRYYRKLKAAGIERKGLHSLRHTFATNLVNGVKQTDGSIKSLTPKQVADLLGHSISQITSCIM